MPITWHCGKSSANSIAQIPVPVPMSIHRLGLCVGAKKRRLPNVRRKRWCCKSSRSASRYSESDSPSM